MGLTLFFGVLFRYGGLQPPQAHAMATPLWNAEQGHR